MAQNLGLPCLNNMLLWGIGFSGRGQTRAHAAPSRPCLQGKSYGSDEANGMDYGWLCNGSPMTGYDFAGSALERTGTATDTGRGTHLTFTDWAGS